MQLITESRDTGKFQFSVLDLADTLWAVSWLRVMIFAAVYTGLLLLQILQSDFLAKAVWQPINIIMAVAFSLHILFVEFCKTIDQKRAALGALLFIDVILLSAGMAVIGVSHPLFLFLLLIFVAIGGWVLGLSYGLKLGFWGSFLFTLSIVMSPYFSSEGMKMIWIVNNASVFLVALFSGLVGDQILHVSKDLAAKDEKIQTLTDINELIIENIPSGLMVINSEYRVLRANRGAQNIFLMEDLVGRPLNEIFLDLQVILQDFTKEHGQNFFRSEVNYHNHKKEKMVLEVIFSPILRKSGKDTQYVCLLQNLTEIKNLEFAMRQKEKLAAVGQLAAGIAHEIRNPLASISGSIQLLQANLTTQTDEDKKLLAIVIKEIDRLNHLISEFLDFVRPDVRVEDPVQINTLAKEVLEMVRMNEALSKKVIQKTELHAKGIIFGHYDKLKQAVLNIVINAYQAMSETLRPEIFVQTYDADGHVVLVIQDNGVGMTSENIKRMFEPFHTTKANGTGLGLAITHKIVETHNAKIYVESEVGLGTKISLVFPMGHTPDAADMYMKKQA